MLVRGIPPRHGHSRPHHARHPPVHHLPDPRYSRYSRWPYIQELAPRKEYFNAPEAVFDARYLAQLDEFAADIMRKIAWFGGEGQAEHGAIVLLCFEKKIAARTIAIGGWPPAGCRRRLGVEIPEMDPGPGGCK